MNAALQAAQQGVLLQQGLHVVIAGRPKAGKSSLLRMFYQGTFNDDIISTLAIEFFTKIVTADGKRVKLQLWDTAGQERFRSLSRMYYRGANVVLLVYDASHPKGLDERLAYWISEIKAGTVDPDVPIYLVANKCDLDGTSEAIETGRKFAAGNNCMFMPTSAKANAGLTELFESAAEKSVVFQKHDDLYLMRSKYGGGRARNPTAIFLSCC